MKRLIHMFLIILPLTSVAALHLNSVVGGSEFFGLTYATLPLESDSTIDFSEIAKYGEDISWKYLLADDTTLTEHRGTSWRSYSKCGDTLLLKHREDYREKSDIVMSDSIVTNNLNGKSYIADTRRDMTFCYADSGYQSSHFIPVSLLILAEGDTLRNCVCMVTERDYARHNGHSGRLLGTIHETEKTWKDPDTHAPFAYSSIRTVKINDTVTSAFNESVVFPRSLNETITQEIKSKGTPTFSDIEVQPTHGNAKGIPDLGNAPAVTVENQMLKVNSPCTSNLSVCDMAGRVWYRATHIDTTTTIPLYGLPDGEYVVSVSSPESVSSITIKLKP